MTKRGAPMRFLRAALASDTDECIVWPYAIVAGYARVTYRSQQRQASHVVLELLGKPAPETDHPKGPMVLHSCDDSACVNPRHVRWGDHTQNMADYRRRGPGLRRLRWEAEQRARAERRRARVRSTASRQQTATEDRQAS